MARIITSVISKLKLYQLGYASVHRYLVRGSERIREIYKVFIICVMHYTVQKN